MSFRLCWHSLALCAIITFLGLLEGCQAILPPGDRAHYVFHGDQRSPGEIRAAGGFLPRRQTRYHRPTTFSLLHYAQGRWNRAYVSTSTQFGQAAVNFAGAGNYVYRIHITPNMIDVNDVLSASSPFPSQREYAALGGIPWDAVQGWWRIPLSENSNIFSLFNNLVCGSNDAADLVTYRYERDYEPLFSPNADYDGERYVGSHVQTSADADASVLGATNIRQAIADLAGAAERFMHRHGSAVGWRAGQTFPLWVPVPGTEESRRRRCPSVSGSSDDDSNLPSK
ncbi:putative enterotoxin [Ophiocordyceps unilateralis]|uniref:Enterotoxin n=1 Tax=Ophiocordyceps unilateralis TaxID=268505 RepID=A0A2A9P2E6_OPHUN|nr:putative enterotoxin [Ophiocordyceps unilateralis]